MNSEFTFTDTMARSGVTGVLVKVAIGVCVIVIACQQTMAGYVNIQKVGTFQLLKPLEPGAVGNYSGSVETKAKCGCNYQQAGDNVPPNSTWVIATGFPLGVVANCSSSATHANAAATLRFGATPPYNIVPPWPRSRIDVTLQLELLATASPCPHGRSWSWAKGKAKAKVPMGRLFIVTVDDLADIKFKKRTKNVWKLNRSTLGLYVKETNKNKTTIRDPITLEFLEEETGIVFSDTLMTFDASVTGHADATLDFSGDALSEGISLVAPADGLSNSSFQVDFPGLWVTSSPGSFGASIIDGVFSATGCLDGLAWDLTWEGDDVVGASLNPSYVPLLDVEAEPDTSEWSVGNHYNSAINSPIDCETWDSCVPEPTTLALLALSGVGLLIRRRRK